MLGLIPAIALAVLWARKRAAGSHWESIIAPELLNVLLEPSGKGGIRQGAIIAAFALAAATIGLAGPTWERLPQPVEQRSDALVIVLDLSLSMYAQDVPPSRIVRARQKITDVLRARDEGFTALVAYAGDAHSVAPLTDDTDTIQNLLAALSPGMMPVLGSNVRSALGLARQLLDNAGFAQGRILLVTDGVARASDLTEHAHTSFPISILGVGTASGGTIPLDFVDQPGDVLRAESGEIVRARLDAQYLSALADAGHGRYRTMTLSDEDISHLLSTTLVQDDEMLEVEREFDTWADMGYWVCIALIPLALLGFRRGLLAVVCLGLVPLPAEANLWDDLWQRRDQQAVKMLEQGDPAAAAELFEDPGWRAAARYRAEDYAGAAEAFATQQSATGMYNLGNALAQQGDLQTAIAAYSEVLAQQPAHEDAAFNKALLEELLQQQQSQQQQNEQQQQDGQGSDDSESTPSGSGEQQDQTAEQDPGEQSEQPSGQSESGDEQSEPARGSETELADARDEQQDALEQWLRRVPDDPGGLLRRKFRYETNQRLRRGEYRTNPSEQIW
ncbi:MAG: VWA domain-containing protein [Pseudomonadales bacterium]|nr:VWA domain-containing protein [Pseudomonadales bacterium]NIX09549.1 VWA domain-containing protein [Pseudomonadales bacterium]